MYQDRIKFLKRAIKRTYKQYTRERTDGEASIKDVADFFNIPIDEERIEDYYISAINISIPFIEINDTKTNTSYISEYTNDAELLNFYGSGEPTFNRVVVTTPTHKIESLYYIGTEKPIIERLTINDGEYDLVFEREFPNSIGLFRNEGIQFVISYIQNINKKGRNLKQRLLTKLYTKSNSDEESTDSFEQIYTYGPPFAVRRNISQDKYAYVRNNSIIYGVGELSNLSNNSFLSGHCFESALENTKEYDSFNIDAYDYPFLKDKETKSAMIFRGYTDENSHYLEIYKNRQEAIIDYSKRYQGETMGVETRIPLSRPGKISPVEIQLVIATLQEKYRDDSFISIVSSELDNFSKKIEIKNGTVEEDIDILNPRLYIDRPLGDTADIVEENKDEFMKTIRDQFNAATTISQTNKSSHKRVIKPEEN